MLIWNHRLSSRPEIKESQMVARELFVRPYRILVSDDDEGCRESVREALAGQ